MREQRILNKHQREAVEHGNGPLLIIAGAGTGKTTVITERVKHLILEKGIKPEQILALTFTEKAATEMEERIDKIMPYGYTQMWISTFHSFCDQILREEAINIGISPNFRLMTETESIMFLKKHMFSFNLKYFRPLGNPNKFLEALLVHFSRLADEDIFPEEYLKFAKAQNKISTTDDAQKLEKEKLMELAQAYKAYSEIKIKEGLLDFSDLIAQTLQLLRTRKNILKKYQEKFVYILVDEFQDTNFSQNELAILLAGDNQNITVVADDDQAIYRWRGAALSNVIQFKNNFPGAKIVTLSLNYRSTQEILDRAYKLIQNNNPGRLEVIENIDKKLKAVRKAKPIPIELIHEQRVDEEAEKIAEKIKSLVKKSKYEYKDFAILVRANNHSQPITVALQRNRIPYQFLGPGYLFNQEEVKDLISYFKVLYNLEDSISLYRILNMDIFNIPARDINVLLGNARRKGLSLFEMLERVDETYLSDISKEKVKKLTAMILRHLDRIKKDKPGQILYYFLVDSGLYKSFLDVKSDKEENAAQNIAKFFDKLKTFETLNPDATVYSIVDWIDLMMQMGDSPIVGEVDFKNMNAVNILTIHSSKGLEFPVVFMVNLVSGRFPTRERNETIPIAPQLIKEILPEGDYHMQEERRLFYVGMTRARDLLIFTAADFYADAKRQKKISPFVYEALPELLKETIRGKDIKQLSLLEATREYKGEEESFGGSRIEDFKIKSISYSQLQAFDICPLHYRARFLLNLPTPATAPLSFGISIHNTFKDFYELRKLGKNVLIKDFLALLSKNWISEGYQEKAYMEKMRENGEKLIKDYYKNFFNPKHIPLSLELPFSFYIPRGKNENLKVTGKIDRIDRIEGGKIEIIDYKTGQSDKITKGSYGMQLGIYALAATKVENQFLKREPKDIRATLFYLSDGKKFSEDLTAKNIEEVKNNIVEKVQEIERSDFKCSKSILCQSCEYKMLCNSL